MIINPSEDFETGTEKVKKFLHSHGLKAERIIIADYMPEIKSLSQVSTKLKEELNAAMQKIGYWKITLDKTAGVESAITTSEKFNLNAEFNNGCLELTFTGRLDTLNSPEVLAFFKDFEKEHDINNVLINCEKLDYISSAGLRILLIMHKSSKKGLTLENTNQLINEILEQSGFNSIFTIKK